MDLELIILIAFYGACVALTAWTTYRVARRYTLHWGWKALSVPASFVAYATVIFLLGIALGWTGEDMLRRMTRGGFTFMLLHTINVFWGSRWFGPRRVTPPSTQVSVPKAETFRGVTRVQVTLFGEKKDASALEARAKTIDSRAREALPGVVIDVAISMDTPTSETALSAIRSDAMHQKDHQAVESILQPIIRSAL